MRKCMVALTVLMILVSSVAASAESFEKEYVPEAGEGWLICTIHHERQEFKYKDSVKSMTGVLHHFVSERYTLSFSLDKKIKVGEPMKLNAINLIEIISSEPSTAGYYASKKSRGTDVESEVLLMDPAQPEILQGTFSVVVPKGDRWVGDLRPGILDAIELEDGEFCFYPAL